MSEIEEFKFCHYFQRVLQGALT